MGCVVMGCVFMGCVVMGCVVMGCVVMGCVVISLHYSLQLCADMLGIGRLQIDVCLWPCMKIVCDKQRLPECGANTKGSMTLLIV